MGPKTQDAQALPTKEAGMFRQLIKQYESKLYKKGIKTADQILKKFPENGETLAMKGLLMNCLERKEEAYDLVKKGVKANLRSHVCWHVYGLLYRSDREYDEAIKCYKNSLRMDKDNLTVLRDLAQLQIQMRDLPGFLDTRQTLLELKPTNRQNWIALALAHHMLGNYEVASTVLDSYESPEDGSEAYEHSEIVLYKIGILAEGGKPEDALATLDAVEAASVVKDKLGALEIRAKLLLEVGRAAGAEAVYRRLLNINIENYKYHEGLRAAITLAGGSGSAAANAALNTVYAKFQEEHSHSTAARRIPLDFLTGEAFAAAADVFVRKYLSKGIPSLFTELKPLYADSEKATLLGELFHTLEKSLETTGAYPPLTGTGGTSPPAGPQALVWTRLYLALHHDKLGNVSEALRYADLCIEHTPTLIEAHSARARVLKHAGDVVGAAESAERARKLDLADRYLNCKAVKALFRAGRTEDAEATALLFTRDGEQSNNLLDMQATWYELSSARAYAARGDLGRALKRYLKIDAHFADFVEDQFDFHSYCMRKQTMRAYVDMLRMEDRLYAHPVYAAAVAGAVGVYLRLHDDPPGSKEQQEEALLAGMSEEEAKKYRSYKKKAEAKKKKAEAGAAAAAAAAKKGGDANKSGADKAKKDSDPDGEALVATPDPLGEATKLIKRLVSAAGDRLESQLLAFEVYSRKGKLLLALKALKTALKLAGPEEPRVFAATVRLAQLVESSTAAVGDKGAAAAAPAAGVLKEQINTLLGGGATLAAFQGAWCEKHASQSLAHSLTAAQTTAAVHPEKSETAALAFAKAGIVGDHSHSCSHSECVGALKWLQQAVGTSHASAVDEFKAACGKVFPLSREMGGGQCVAVESEKEVEDDVDGVVRGVSGLEI